ncbi:MAG: hypothetical protein ACOCWG_05590 [bacterium]
MAKKEKKIIKKLLAKYGEPYSGEIGINVKKENPSNLFMWFVASNLFSARISSSIAVDAAKSLFKRGWKSPRKMNKTSWNERVQALNEAHYTRYQERTSTFLGDLSKKILEEYDGDLRKLREKAGKNPQKMRKLLKEFKGVGNVGVDIFFRELQMTWKELYPFADKKTLKAAKKMDLPNNANDLLRLTGKSKFIKLLAALVRADLNKDYDLTLGEEKQEKDEKIVKKANKLAESKSKKDLYQEARSKNIQGRSNMNKQKLAEKLIK